MPKKLCYLSYTKANLAIILVIVFITLSACTNLSKKNNYSITTFKNGEIKTLSITFSDYKQTYEFDSLGQCKKINSYNKSNLEGEQLSFHDRALVQKIWFKENVPNGYMYDFYSSSGALKAFRQVNNGLEKDLGIDYYNSKVPVVKSSLYFNDSGKIYYKQNFDSLSNFVGQEGKKAWFVK